MDLLEVIQKLRLAKERVERAIANLERLEQVTALRGAVGAGNQWVLKSAKSRSE